jgi:hypothetical protein
MKSEGWTVKQLIEFASITFLWIASITLWKTKKFPYALGLFAGLHVCETVVIGFKTGQKYGKNNFYSFCMSMVFGHAWWLPLYRQMKQEDLTDNDFLRRATDGPAKEMLS